MRALVHDPSRPQGLGVQDVESPNPDPDELVIDVAAFSLNYAEIQFIDRIPPGDRLGLEAAGTVTHAADTGAGPAVGTRVLTLDWSGGGWAEQRAVRANSVALSPNSVDHAAAGAHVIAPST